MGLPYVHYLIDTLPFFHTFLRRLGYDVQVLRPGPGTLAEGDRRCAAPGACAPVKLLHGLAGAGVDVLVAPLFVHLPVPNAGDVTYTCPMAQGAPDMTARALTAEGSPTRVLRPVLFEREGDGFDVAAGAAGSAARGRDARGGRRLRRRPHARAASAPPTPPRWPTSDVSRRVCEASASVLWPGRASTTTRWSSSSERPT